MSGDRRVLADPTRQLAPIIEGLDVLVGRLASVRYALVGGLAVFARVDVHRVTSDIDAAVATTELGATELVAEVGQRVPGRQPSFTLPNDVVFDVLLSEPTGRAPRPGIGGRRAARALAASWAIDTAEELILALDPPVGCGDVAVNVARVPALIALKLVVLDDPARPADKQRSDLFDLWRLLTADISATPDHLRAIVAGSPARLFDWTREQLRQLLSASPDHVVRQLAGQVMGPSSVNEVLELWEYIVSPVLSERSGSGH